MKYSFSALHLPFSELSIISDHQFFQFFFFFLTTWSIRKASVFFFGYIMEAMARNKLRTGHQYWGSFIYYVRKIFRNTNISYHLIRTRTCAYQGVRNVSFSENFANVTNEWSPGSLTMLSACLTMLRNTNYDFRRRSCWNFTIGESKSKQKFISLKHFSSLWVVFGSSL